jgi:hypothetical protein
LQHRGCKRRHRNQVIGIGPSRLRRAVELEPEPESSLWVWRMSCSNVIYKSGIVCFFCRVWRTLPGDYYANSQRLLGLNCHESIGPSRVAAQSLAVYRQSRHSLTDGTRQHFAYHVRLYGGQGTCEPKEHLVATLLCAQHLPCQCCLEKDPFFNRHHGVMWRSQRVWRAGHGLEFSCAHDEPPYFRRGPRCKVQEDQNNAASSILQRVQRSLECVRLRH